jgi:hypothetical protein
VISPSFFFSKIRLSRRVISFTAILLAFSTAELCSAAEATFGPGDRYSLQLPADWTAKQNDKSLAASGPPFVELNAYVVSTEHSPEQSMAKVVTDILEKKPGFKLLEKGSVKTNAGRQANFIRYQRRAASELVWVDYYFQLAEKEVVRLVFAFRGADSESAKRDIEAILNSVKVATTAGRD